MSGIPSRGRWSGGKGLLFRLVAIALGTVLFLGIAEIGFRIAGIRGTYLRPRVDTVLPGPEGIRERVPYGFVPGATVRSNYDGDPRGVFEPGDAVDHVFNHAGWRDVDHPLAKPPGTFRILGLGDSYLFGQGVPRDKVVLARLGEKLQALHPEVTIETINTGMSGYNTAMERDLLVHRGLAYDPDLLLVFFVLNDVEGVPGREPDEVPKLEFFRGYTNVYQQPDWLSGYSYLWSWARQRYLQTVEGKRFIHHMLDAFLADESNWSRVAGAIDDIDRIARRNDLPWALVIFPFFYDLDGDYPFAPIHERIVAQCEARGIPVLDLRQAYRAYHGPELWVHPTDQHPNEIAHEIAADAVVKMLEARSADLLRRLP